MKRFVLNILCFLIPVFLCVLLISTFGLATLVGGEIKNFSSIIEEQRKDKDCLIGMAYSNNTKFLKITNANYYKADVLALGTSRVMQFKSDYFKNNDFYNAGGGVSDNFDEYTNFMKNLEYRPKVVILGLDPWVFNDAWNSYACQDYNDFKEIQYKSFKKEDIIKEAIQDYVDNKWNFKSINCFENNIGFNARIKQNGFLWDGSYYYGDTYRSPEKQEDYGTFNLTKQRIDNGNSRFEWGEEVDIETTNNLQIFLGYCKDNEINVIGIITPMAPSIQKYMVESQNYLYIYDMKKKCIDLFDTYDFELYDFWDNNLSVDDSYYIDGFHGSDVVYAMMVYNIIMEHGSILEKYVDIDILESLLELRDNNLVLD